MIIRCTCRFLGESALASDEHLGRAVVIFAHHHASALDTILVVVSSSCRSFANSAKHFVDFGPILLGLGFFELFGDHFLHRIAAALSSEATPNMALTRRTPALAGSFCGILLQNGFVLCPSPNRAGPSARSTGRGCNRLRSAISRPNSAIFGRSLLKATLAAMPLAFGQQNAGIEVVDDFRPQVAQFLEARRLFAARLSRHSPGSAASALKNSICIALEPETFFMPSSIWAMALS